MKRIFSFFPYLSPKNNRPSHSNRLIQNDMELADFSTIEIKKILAEEERLADQFFPQEQRDYSIFDYKVSQIELNTLHKLQNAYTHFTELKLKEVYSLNQHKVALCFAIGAGSLFFEQIIQIYDLKKIR